MRFYFHVGNERFVHDKDGIELPDVGAARLEALAYARSLANLEEGFLGRLRGGHVIVVDEEGIEVARVPLPTKRRNQSHQ